MMEEDDELAFNCCSSWEAAVGSPDRSVCVLEEDGAEKSGQAELLVLVPPSGDHKPCELTVFFERRLCDVSRINILSTARAVEVYGRVEQDGDFEYVSTMRCELTNDFQPELGRCGVDSKRSSYSALLLGELSSNEEFCEVLPDSKQLAGRNKLTGNAEQSMSGSEPSWERVTKISLIPEDQLSQPLTDGEKIEEGIVAAYEHLDQTDWVECPHSPTRSSGLGSDDEADSNKCGFFLVDRDDNPGETHSDEDYKEDVIEQDSRGISSGRKDEHIPGEAQVASTNNAQDDIAFENGKTRELANTSSMSECATHSQKNLSNFTMETRGAPPTVRKDITKTVPLYCGQLEVSNTEPWRSLKLRLLSLTDKSRVILLKVALEVVPGPRISSLSTTDGFSQPSARTSSLMAMLGPGIVQFARELAESRKLVSVAAVSGEQKFGYKTSAPVEPACTIPVVCHGLAVDSSTQTNRGFSSYLGSIELVRETGSEYKSSAAGAETLPVEKQLLHCSDGTKVELEKGIGIFVPSGTLECELNKEIGILVPDESSESEKEIGNLVPDRTSELELEQRENDPESLELISRSGVLPGATIDAERHAPEKNQNLSHDIVQRLDRLESNQNLSHEIVERLDRLESIFLRMETSMNLALENIETRLKLLEVGERSPRSSTAANLPQVSGLPVDTRTINVSRWFEKPSLVTPTTPVFETTVGQFTPSTRTNVDSFCPGLVSSTSPSVTSSVSPTLPLWPLSSEMHVSFDVTSHLSNPVVSAPDKIRSGEQLVGLSYPSEESMWKVRECGVCEGELCSDSESSSYRYEDEELDTPCPPSCPESVSSSPFKPVAQTDSIFNPSLVTPSPPYPSELESPPYPSALANSLLNLLRDENRVPHVGNYITQEEQEHSVDRVCRAQVESEVVSFKGYGAVQLPSSNELNETSNEDRAFWDLHRGGPQVAVQIDWEDSMLQSQNEKLFSPNASCGGVDSDLTGLTTQSDEVHDSKVLCMDDLTTYDVFPTSIERILREGPKAEVNDAHLDSLKGEMQDSFIPLDSSGHEEVRVHDESWSEEWNDESHLNGDGTRVSYMTMRSWVKRLDPRQELLLQEELFPDEWDWFTSGVPPTSDASIAHVDAKQSVWKDESQTGTYELSGGYRESFSLLDEDISYGGNSNLNAHSSKDLGEQMAQWSVLDKVSPVPTFIDFGFEEPFSRDCSQHKEQRSLLDEDTMILQQTDNAADEENLLVPVYGSPNHFNLCFSGPAARSPSSHTSRSNPFDDDCGETLDLKCGSEGIQDKEVQENFEEFDGAHDFETPDSERTQSLLFHLSL